MDSEIEDSRRIVTASYNVLKHWQRDFSGNDDAALKELCDALEKVEMNKLRRILVGSDE